MWHQTHVAHQPTLVNRARLNSRSHGSSPEPKEVNRMGEFDKQFTAALVAVQTGVQTLSMMMKDGRASGATEKSGAADLVTQADVAVERAMVAMIRGQFPEAVIIGEEDSTGKSEEHLLSLLQSPECWIIDPLDGTSNAVHGFPAYTVVAGYINHGVVQVGIIADPTRNEMFAAMRGHGATLNGQPIRVAECTTLSQALLATGFHWTPEGRARAIREFNTIAPRVRNMRCLGSGALHLAYVACGRLSGFWQSNLNPWDIAAGSLLVEEAGGRVSSEHGRAYFVASKHIVATAPGFHDQLVQLVDHP